MTAAAAGGRRGVEATVLLVLAATTTGLFWIADLDLAASALFHRPGAAGGGWPGADHPVARGLHRLTPWLAAAIAASGLGMIAAGRLRPGGRGLAAGGLMVLLGLALGPGLVVNAIFKDHWRRPRPRQTATLGGDHRYVPPLAVGPYGKSFPSGDASVGFACATFYYALRRRRPAAARGCLAGSVAMGTAMGLGRVASGTHFVSDVLWSGYLVWGTLLVLDRALASRPVIDPVAPWPGPRRAALATGAGAALLVLAPLAMPFRQSVERAWGPGATDHAIAAAGRFDLVVEVGHARVILEPVARLAGPGAAGGAVIALGGDYDGFGLPGSRVEASIEAPRADGPVRLALRSRGLFADLEGRLTIRVAAAAASEVAVEVRDGILTFEAGPGAGTLPRLSCRIRPDALRLRNVRSDQVRIEALGAASATDPAEWRKSRRNVTEVTDRGRPVGHPRDNGPTTRSLGPQEGASPPGP